MELNGRTEQRFIAKLNYKLKGIIAMKKVSFLIPYRDASEERNAILDWNIKRLYLFNDLFGNIEICIGEHNDKSELFNRSLAINRAARISTGDYFFILDADCFFSPELLVDALRFIDSDEWMIPHSGMCRLNESITAKILSGEVNALNVNACDIELFVQSCSGLNAIRRDKFEQIGGFDERFWGWGFEDVAFMITANTFLGAAGRLDHKIFHLWHTWPQNIEERNPKYKDGELLILEYEKANWNKEAIMRLKGLT